MRADTARSSRRLRPAPGRPAPAFAGLLVVLLAAASSAAPTFFGPTPYLSDADIPAGLYASGSPDALEDFEDGSLDFGITASDGLITSTLFPTIIDSVDADDGVIDGSGLAGESWFYANGFVGVLFTFANPVVEAGLVFTDAGGGATVTFEAFGPGGVSLGTAGPAIADNANTGETGEDRFFGVADPDGIESIELRVSGGGIEIDHVQYGPEPSAPLLLGSGLVALAFAQHRRRG